MREPQDDVTTCADAVIVVITVVLGVILAGALGFVIWMAVKAW